MRRARFALLCALGLFALASGADAATLEGQVIVRGGDGTESLADVTVHREFRTPEGEVVQQSTQTDGSGRFRFVDVPAPGQHYIYADYRDITFPGRWVDVKEPAEVVPADVEVFPKRDDASRLQISTARAIIAPDEAGAYFVRQRIYIMNPDAVAVQVAESAAALVEIGLLPEHDPVEAAILTPTSREEAVVLVRDGKVEFRGPVFPDFSVLDVLYSVDAGGDALSTVLRFPRAVEYFRVLVPDANLAVVADGLYPTPRPRPERDPDADIASLPLQRYVGFDIPAGAELALSITPIPKVAPASKVTAAVLALLVGALLVVVGYPFASAPGAAQMPAVAAAGPSVEQAARDGYLAAVADLEHDFEMGKISAADRDRMHDELRREAVGAIAANRAARSRDRKPARARDESRGGADMPGVCGCGHASTPDARFCSACGRKL
jgi:hypothetical protein